MTQDRYSALTEWKDQLTKDLEEARQQLADVQRRIRESEERLQLVNNLLSLERPEGSIPAKSKPPVLNDDLLDVCDELIRAAGRPMHIRELHAAVLERGVPLPGRGEEANLIVRLHRSEGRFKRVGRGLYAPADFREQEVRPTRKIHRPRRSKQS